MIYKEAAGRVGIEWLKSTPLESLAKTIIINVENQNIALPQKNESAKDVFCGTNKLPLQNL